MIAIVLLILLKSYLFLTVGQTTDYFFHSYRAWTLTHFGRDEIGNVLPILFHSPAGYQLPLTSYLFIPFGGMGFEFLIWLLPALLLTATFSSPTLGLIFLATPAFLWPGNYGTKLLVLIICVIIAAFKRKKFFLPITILMAAIIFAILISGIPGVKRTFISQNFGLFESDKIVTTINALRGEHGISFLVKVLYSFSTILIND